MYFLIVYLIIGLIFCGYSVTFTAGAVAKEEEYNPILLMAVSMVLAIVASPLWPLLLGVSLAANKAKRMRRQ